jgi:hypothetical protein
MVGCGFRTFNAVQESVKIEMSLFRQKKVPMPPARPTQRFSTQKDLDLWHYALFGMSGRWRKERDTPPGESPVGLWTLIGNGMKPS